MSESEPEMTSVVRVVQAGDGVALVATRRLDAEAMIHVAGGTRLKGPTRTSVQQGPDDHRDVPAGTDTATAGRDYPWYALNHSCDPNAYWIHDHLMTRRVIEAGEAITFDYETTEDELATPFLCACGSPACGGEMVRGYRYLSHEERLRRLLYLRPDLQEALRLGE